MKSWLAVTVLLGGLIISSDAKATLSEEESHAMAYGIAATLVASMSFMMCLQYLTNHKDDEIRFYTYSVMSATVSIFSAVLLFQAGNTFFRYLLGIDGEGFSWDLLRLDLAQLVGWSVLLQLVLAYFCGIWFNSDAEGLTDYEIQEMRKNLNSFAVLSSHVAGFASINAWGTLQQHPFFSQSWLFALLVVPIAFLAMAMAFVVLHLCREYVATGDASEKDEYEQAWDDAALDAENDIVGLTLSFLTVQALRMMLTGRLPAQEGEEHGCEGECLFAHEVWQGLSLYACGLVSLGLTLWVIWNTRFAHLIEEMSVSPSPMSKPTFVYNVVSAEKLLDRLIEVCHCTLYMGFSWCILYGTQYLLGGMRVASYLFGVQDTPTILGLFEAVVQSVFSFMIIWFCDKFQDSHKERTLACAAEKGEVNLVLNALLRVHRGDAVLVGDETNVVLVCAGKYLTLQQPLTRAQKAGSKVMLLEADAAIVDKMTKLTQNCQATLPSGDVCGAMFLKHCQFCRCCGSPRPTEKLHGARVCRKYSCAHRRAEEEAKARFNEATKRIIMAAGILIGFSWEKCFDAAVERLSMDDVFVRFFLALFCALPPIPAWRYYILPLLHDNSWQHGIIVPHKTPGEVEVHIGNMIHFLEEQRRVQREHRECIRHSKRAYDSERFTKMRTNSYHLLSSSSKKTGDFFARKATAWTNSAADILKMSPRSLYTSNIKSKSCPSLVKLGFESPLLMDEEALDRFAGS
eukprot:TRINITY_DN9456_c0_g1_i3.p1 TRINITY_DN9456_c0_g1~~TRINITY_DN9456_c0_g1_i3.p1  ORF type:complete len:742 (-),score=149.49 TRINITY_DN9456_c0_g1_i3:735-2960(-)